MSESRDAPSRVPVATYRLQLGPGFTFRDAAGVVPYLHDLGISHVYTSPWLRARAGSTHGYDIVDHGAINPELGTEADFDEFAAALDRHGMGHVLDFVPNHMGIGQADNAWWLDVLEWGDASPYASWFDIDWQPDKRELAGKVLVPTLGDHYGRVLGRGELRLAFDAAAGTFSVWYHEHRFPLHPATYARVLATRLKPLREERGADDALVATLERMVTELGRCRTAGLSARRRVETRSHAQSLARELAARAAELPELRAHIDGAVSEVNGTPGDRRSLVALHRLLERQRYRLAYWRVAADEINYRRFFDINDLAGLRMERAEVFEATHRLVLRLIREGRLHGLRLDHVDGLYDPKAYAERLQRRAGEALGRAHERAPLWIVVEKILAHHESPRGDWPVAGTTGYELAAVVNGVFVDAAGERAIDRTWRRFTGEHHDFDEVLWRAKHHVMNVALSAELEVLARQLDRVTESHWDARDYTRHSIREALKEVVACFPVYRTYVDRDGASAQDRRDVDWAVAHARRRRPDLESGLLDLVRLALVADAKEVRAAGFRRADVLRFAMRVQQYTGPVMAKGFEDTALYRYPRLASLNEVGGDPRRFSTSPAAFHHFMGERARRWPHAMSSTATHDGKRGEDVRVRIDVLSEIAGEWDARVRRWARINRRHRRMLDDGPAPGPIDEYLLYQTLVGAWPAALTGETSPSPADVGELAERVCAYAVKAAREAKLRSSWVAPNTRYEEALTAFVRALLDAGAANNPFLDDFVPFQARVAWFGAASGLGQTLIRLTAPGVPDTYQGTEDWDLSLVDPDNRRPVDFDRRAATLAEFDGSRAEGDGDVAARVRALRERWTDGRCKTWVMRRVLALRHRYRDLFLAGEYAPAETAGPGAERVLAYARSLAGEHALVAVQRLAAGPAGGDPARAAGPEAWSETSIACPADGAWRDVLSGRTLSTCPGPSGPALDAGEVFAALPAALLVSAPE